MLFHTNSDLRVVHRMSELARLLSCLLLMGLMILFSSGCATMSVRSSQAPPTLEEQVKRVAQESGLTHERLAQLSQADGWTGGLTDERLLLPFAITPEVRSFAERNTRYASSPYQQINALIRAMYGLGKLETQYVSHRTATAHETLRVMRGNCFSFTNLLVASARAIGLPAYFMDASRARSLVRMEDGRMVHAGHIVAGIETNLGLMTVDFNVVRGDSEPLWATRLRDEEAVALFLNNLGFDALKLGQDPTPYYRAAIRLAPELESPWNNLASSLKRQGKREEARQMLQQALAQRPASFAPYYNLGLMDLEEGNYAQASQLFERGLLRRFDNPYLLYNLGMAYLRQGHATRARLALATATQLDKGFSQARTKLEALRHH